MKLNLSELNPAVFFPFDEDDEDNKGGVYLRLATGEILEKIRKKTTKKKVEFRRGQRFEVEETNDAKHSELLWDYVIHDWKGLEDENGDEIPCTTENKAMLMKKSVKFSGFIGNCVEQLNDDYDEHIGDLEKN